MIMITKRTDAKELLDGSLILCHGRILATKTARYQNEYIDPNEKIYSGPQEANSCALLKPTIALKHLSLKLFAVVVFLTQSRSLLFFLFVAVCVTNNCCCDVALYIETVIFSSPNGTRVFSLQFLFNSSVSVWTTPSHHVINLNHSCSFTLRNNLCCWSSRVCPLLLIIFVLYFCT